MLFVARGKPLPINPSAAQSTDDGPATPVDRALQDTYAESVRKLPPPATQATPTADLVLVPPLHSPRAARFCRARMDAYSDRDRFGEINRGSGAPRHVNTKKDPR